MNGFDVGDFCCGDDGGHVEVAVGRARRPDADGFVSKTNMKRITIGFTIDGDSANAEFAARIHHPQRDFAAIGNQYLAKHSMPFKSGDLFTRDERKTRSNLNLGTAFELTQANETATRKGKLRLLHADLN